MDILYECAEVVWVKDGARLVDAESYERTYALGDGATLVAGRYYVARWPPDTPNPHFLHARTVFDGPFESRREAEAARAAAAPG